MIPISDEEKKEQGDTALKNVSSTSDIDETSLGKGDSELNFWNTTDLNKAFPKCQGKGKKGPPPDYRTSAERVVEWRQMTNEEQIEKLEAFKALSSEQKKVIEKEVPGKKTTNRVCLSKLNYWNNTDLNKAFPKQPGKGQKAPTPFYRTSSALVREWRQFDKEKQESLIASYATLDKEEKRKIESKVVGSRSPCLKETNLTEILENELKRLEDGLTKKRMHNEKLTKSSIRYGGLDLTRNRSQGITEEEKKLTLDFLKELHLPKMQAHYEKLKKESNEIKSNATPQNIVPYITMNTKDIKDALNSLGISYSGITSRHNLALLLHENKYHGGKSETAQLQWYDKELKNVADEMKKVKNRVNILKKSKPVS